MDHSTRDGAGHDGDGRAHADGAAVRIVVRPLGSPVPLGFFAFSIATALTASVELGWLPQTEGRTVALIVLACIVPLEAGPALFALLARDGAGATLMGIFASSWTAFAVTRLTTVPGSQSAALGVFWILLAGVSLLLAGASARTKPFYSTILVLAAARYAAGGFHELHPAHWLALVAGWLGLPILVAGLYGALALLIEDTVQRTVLPLFRRGQARAAMEGDLGDQLSRIADEAGVRQQL